MSLFARYELSAAVPTAATDGERIILNPEFFHGLERDTRCGLLLHEILHAALEHPSRARSRDRRLWNIAADIVVNGIIDDFRKFTLPDGAIRHKEFAKLSVEQVYEQIAFHGCSQDWGDAILDLLAPAAGACERGSPARLHAHWRNALQRGFISDRLARDRQAWRYGSLSAGLLRAWEDMNRPHLDWRSQLWRFLAVTPDDFDEFDRRFVYQGLYLETLQSLGLRVRVCVDTSGSVDDATLSAFGGEVASIVRSYPHLDVKLFFCDTNLEGPYELQRGATLPAPRGGGGTSFRPFFDRITEECVDPSGTLCIYLTDGDGAFPPQRPEQSVLWAVTQGGKPSDHFPFGDVVRLAND